MLVTSKEMLKIAKEKNFAVPSANFIDIDSMRWHVEVAEKLQLPLILALAEGHISPNINIEDSALIGRKYAEAASVPIVLHLDHGNTPELIKKAIDIGFSSVMIDASMESFDENVRQTIDIVEYAHKKGVVVEAEIGHVGVARNIGVSESKVAKDDSKYTTVESTVEFCNLTNVDSLAISIGTAHGLYKGVPKINFERLHEIAMAIDTPLVLHGGSSSGDDNLNKCATEGISKINIYTDFLVAAHNAITEGKPTNYFEHREYAKQGMQKCLEHYYSVFATQKI